MFNARGSERVALLAAVNPVSQAAGTVTSGWVSMAQFASVLAIIHAGALGAAATLDGKFQQAQDAAGTGAKDIAGRAIVQMTKAGTDKSNKQSILEVRPSDLDLTNNFTHVRLSLTVGTAASLISAVVLGLGPRAGAASGRNAASVDQVV
jgi:hypothetical protein